MIDKQIKDKFRYADGTNEQDNYENFINSFDVDDEVYYRGKHYIKFINEQLKAKEQECEELKKKLQADNCLTEIKEICENNDELQGDFNVVDCDKYKLGKHNLANKIIQKISEYEGENERN